MSSDLRNRPVSTDAMMELFSDETTIAFALRFEAVLARAQAAEGVIEAEAAKAIFDACGRFSVSPIELASEAALAGTLAIPLVNHLRAEVGESFAHNVHRGATSQDVADTVMMMQAREGTVLLLADCTRISTALLALAEQHATTPALGRTLLQDALPIGLGLRFAQWAAGIDNAAHRLEAEAAANAKIQFGGAVGTRAGQNARGGAIAARMAQELGLAPGVPWHSRRVGVAAVASAVGILVGALGKLARDVSLLSQNAIGEVREPAIEGRGRSSAMAHKRNPTGCQVAISAAIRAPGLVATILSANHQEEERGLGGWQAEGPVLADLYLLCAGSAASIADIAEGLEIDEVAIARNLQASGLGSDIGESADIVARIIGHHRKD